jgi:hypothetical protein
MTKCILCGYTFIPGLKNPNVCGNCWRRVAAERHKAGLSRIPSQDNRILRERIKQKKKLEEEYKEQMKDDNFGKEHKWKIKHGQLRKIK